MTSGFVCFREKLKPGPSASRAEQWKQQAGQKLSHWSVFQRAEAGRNLVLCRKSVKEPPAAAGPRFSRQNRAAGPLQSGQNGTGSGGQKAAGCRARQEPLPTGSRPCSPSVGSSRRRPSALSRGPLRDHTAQCHSAVSCRVAAQVERLRGLIAERSTTLCPSRHQPA